MQHATGKLGQRLWFKQITRGIDDLFQTVPAVFNNLHVTISAQGRNHGCDQFLCGQLGFFLVVIDVVINHYRTLRCLTGLAGTQDNADKIVLEHITDMANHIESGVISFHDHIKQHDCGVGVRGD